MPPHAALGHGDDEADEKKKKKKKKEPTFTEIDTASSWFNLFLTAGKRMNEIRAFMAEQEQKNEQSAGSENNNPQPPAEDNRTPKQKEIDRFSVDAFMSSEKTGVDYRRGNLKESQAESLWEATAKIHENVKKGICTPAEGRDLLDEVGNAVIEMKHENMDSRYSPDRPGGSIEGLQNLNAKIDSFNIKSSEEKTDTFQVRANTSASPENQGSQAAEHAEKVETAVAMTQLGKTPESPFTVLVRKSVVHAPLSSQNQDEEDQKIKRPSMGG